MIKNMDPVCVSNQGMPMAKINERTFAGRSSNICPPHFAQHRERQMLWKRNLAAKFIFRHKIKFHHTEFQIPAADCLQQTIHLFPIID